MKTTTLVLFLKIINWGSSRKVMSLVISNVGLNRVQSGNMSFNAGRTYNLFADKVRSTTNDERKT